MSDNTILLQTCGDILEIVLNRPDDGNKITEEMGECMALALSEPNPSYKAVLLRSSGEDFCLGRQSPQFNRATATASEFRRQVADGPLRLYKAFRECRAPIVGVVQGRAYGVGFALAALCDLTVASEDATFLVPEMDAGIPPTLVISALAGRLPYRLITELVYLREAMPAQEARTFGLINRMTSRMNLLEEANRMANKLASSPADSLAAVKEFAINVSAANPNIHTSLAATLISNVLSSAGR